MNSTTDTIVVVTGNKNKASEIASIIRRPVEAVELDIKEIQSLSVEEVATQKALAAFKELNRPVVVDDTGMTIEALNGLPGALVAWFLDSVGAEGLLRMVGNAPNRTAVVSTCIGYADSNGVRTFVGEVPGTLTVDLRGSGGFGYDPIFIPRGYQKTFAEMTAEEKNSLSMRRIALDKFREFLESA